MVKNRNPTEAYNPVENAMHLIHESTCASSSPLPHPHKFRDEAYALLKVRKDATAWKDDEIAAWSRSRLILGVNQEHTRWHFECHPWALTPQPKAAIAPFMVSFFSFALQCNPPWMGDDFRLKLQNSPTLPHIHARFHCNANEQS